MRKITLSLFLFVSIATTMFAQVTAPSFNTAAGTYYNPFSVELEGNNIYYTLDGTEPTKESNKYSGAISISKFGTSTTIKAASFTNNTWSDIVTATYELKVAAPEFSVKSGVYEKLTGNDALKFTTETKGATIYYNHLGKSPITDGSKLWGSLSILATTTVNAVAFVKDESGKEIYSEVSSEYYVISPIALFASANKIENGKYIFESNGKVASSFYENIENGNLNIIDITIKNKYIETYNFCGFTFTSTSGGYTIQDAYGRYLYTDGNNSFNASKTKPSTGAVWSISLNETSGTTIKNTSTGKIIAYNTQKNAFGLYSDNEITTDHKLLFLYKNIEYPTITVTPQDGETLNEFSKFTVTCDAELKYKESNKNYAYYNIGYDTSKKEFDEIDEIDSNTIEFTLDEPIKSNGDYKIVFPAGVFTIDPKGIAKTNKEIIVRYTVENKDIFELTYAKPENKETTNSLQYLYFEFNQEISITDNIVNAVIKDSKNNEYPLSISDMDPWGNKCLENSICLKTEESITSAGEYTFILKKDFVCAKTNSKLTIEKDVTFQFHVVESLKITNITPNKTDIYDSVSEIIIELNKKAIHANITKIEVTDSNKNSYTFTKTTTVEEADKLSFSTPTPITDAGTYTFTIADNAIYCENAYSDMNEIEIIPETTFTFVVKYTTAVENIDAENTDTVIYDLTGRRVNSVNQSGIYIRNGKKIIIK